jgi:hypothetical protein
MYGLHMLTNSRGTGVDNQTPAHSGSASRKNRNLNKIDRINGIKTKVLATMIFC